MSPAAEIFPTPRAAREKIGTLLEGWKSVPAACIDVDENDGWCHRMAQNHRMNDTSKRLFSRLHVCP